jgi:hypothetical protein
VDFDNMMKRLSAYKKDEDLAHAKCHLDEAAEKKRQAQREP